MSKRILFLFFLVTIASSAMAADVMVAKTKIHAEAIVEAERTILYAAAHNIDPGGDCPAGLRDELIWSAKVATKVIDLGVDPTDQQIIDGMDQIVDDGPMIGLRWTDSRPIFTCADIDNATLVAKNMCSRLGSEADRAGMKAGVSIRARCVNLVVGRVRC